MTASDLVDLVDHPEETLYQRLGVLPQATAEQIRNAFREKAWQVHPDKLSLDLPQRLRMLAERDFQQLQQAYRVLIDPQQRQVYDHSLQAASASDLTVPIVNLTAEIPSGVYTIPAPVKSTESAWQIPLASGLVGVALTLIGVALVNLFSLSPQAASIAKVEPVTGSQPLPTDPPTATLPAAAEPEAESLTPDQIERFVKALIQVQPLLKATESKLDQTSSDAERQTVEREFEVAASKVIVANGLTVDEYQRISQKARQDAAVSQAVAKVAQRLSSQL
jgi:curved DNA-binding protein CbpA